MSSSLEISVRIKTDEEVNMRLKIKRQAIQAQHFQGESLSVLMEEPDNDYVFMLIVVKV
jgi:hypothetical protein